MRQEMIKLNRIRIAYSEEDMERLAADGYEPVPDGEKTEKGVSEKASGFAEAGMPAGKPEETVKAVKKPKASKGRKEQEPEAAGGEDKDAG